VTSDQKSCSLRHENRARQGWSSGHLRFAVRLRSAEEACFALLLEAIALAGDRHGLAAVQQALENRGREDLPLTDDRQLLTNAIAQSCIGEVHRAVWCGEPRSDASTARAAPTQMMSA
jgi:hypothetical protein